MHLFNFICYLHIWNFSNSCGLTVRSFYQQALTFDYLKFDQLNTFFCFFPIKYFFVGGFVFNEKVFQSQRW